MKKLIVFAAAMLALSGCSAQDNAASGTENTTVTTTAANSADEDISSEERETVEITADVLSLEENSISVSYEGNEYTIDLSECEYNSNGLDDPSITSRIINNPFGIKTKVKLSCDPELAKAYYCDAITPNGSVQIPDTGRPETEQLIESYALIGKGSCSVYDFTYFEKTEKGEYQTDSRIDISGSDIFLSPKFTEGSSFSATWFKFEDENCFTSIDRSYLLEKGKREETDENGKILHILRSYTASPTKENVYFGKVIETDENSGKVTVELNGGSACTVTPSVTIGCYSFSAGDTVRVRFTDQADYLDSPKETDFDFAVIEKADSITAEVLNFNNGNVYGTDGEKDLTIVPERIVDMDTSEEITDTIGYKKVYVPFENLRIVNMGQYDVRKFTYYVTEVQVGR